MENISLCCGRPAKCPVLAKEGRKYSISDKGQKVYFTKGQLNILVDAVKQWVK
jgi:hypothetical protein